MQNAGIDQLTKTLNDYLGEIVENIISSEGDVLKFAGYDSSCLLSSSSRFSNITFVWLRNELRAAFICFKYCWYDVKYSTINQSINLAINRYGGLPKVITNALSVSLSVCPPLSLSNHFTLSDTSFYSGDAILAVWRVNNDTELNTTVDQVVKCCLNIQDKCGAWETDIGVTLTVKMGKACLS